MIISIFAVIAVFGVLILIHETGHFIMAKKMGVRVERFSIGFGPKILSFKKSETEYLISVIPLGGYVKMAGDEPGEKTKGAEYEFLSKPIFKRFNIIISGPLTNYVFAFLLFSIMFIFGVPAATTEVGQVLGDFPAYSAGIKSGDKIISVNDKTMEYWDDLLLEISNSDPDKKMNLLILRNDRQLKISLKPRAIEAKNIFGKNIKVPRIGIIPAGNFVIVRAHLLKALRLGAEKTIFLTGVTYKGLWCMLTGGISLKESAMGPVGIVVEIGKAAKQGIATLLYLTAYINLAIAIFNLLPIPVLDGGHIMFLALEKIRKKRLNPKTEQAITNTAIAFLVMLMVYVSWNDISRNWGNILKIIK